MKKKTAYLVVSLLLVVGFGYYLREVIDRFNPLVPQEDVYVKINDKAEPDNKRFSYTLTGYNAEGKERKVTFSTSSILKEGTLLKVSAKGAYVEKYEHVEAAEIPKNITL